MLRPGFQTSEVRTGIGTIVAALAAVAAVLFPDRAADLSAGDIVSAADNVKDLAAGLQLQFAQYVSALVAKYGFAGGALVFVYKVWARMSGDRTSLKVAELNLKIAELKKQTERIND